MFILTGSQQFELLDSLTQSLAGRTAIVKLLPFALDEVYSTPCLESVDDVLYRGFYPRIHDKHLVPTEALGFYVNTYVERDLRSLLQVRDLAKFDTFLKMLAARTGRILNLSSLANECDVSHNTAKSWISVLEASFVVFRVRPHHRNFSKRLIKSPKLYFVDVGLACYLLGIAEPAHVASHPLRGALFETCVVSEILKKRCNTVRDSNLYFFRDSAGHEVDLILDYGSQVVTVEIKASATYSSRQVESLERYRKLDAAAVREQILVYCGDDSLTLKETSVVSFRDLGRLTV